MSSEQPPPSNFEAMAYAMGLSADDLVAAARMPVLNDGSSWPMGQAEEEAEAEMLRDFLYPADTRPWPRGPAPPLGPIMGGPREAGVFGGLLGMAAIAAGGYLFYQNNPERFKDFLNRNRVRRRRTKKKDE